MKQFVLAALAATCLSCTALAAPPADFLSELRTARQAIERELARRIDPGKGKPIQLDQPSAQPPSPADRAALKAVFGTEQPLTIKRTGITGKTTQYSATLPAVDYRSGDTRVTWQDAIWQYSVNGNTVDNTVRWPGFDVYGTDLELGLHDIRAQIQQTRGATTHRMQLQAGTADLREVQGAGSAHAAGLELREESTEKNGKLEQRIELSTRRLSFGNGVVLDDLHFAMRLRDLNPELWQQLSDAGDTMPDDAFLALLKPLMLQGARLEVTDLSGDFGGGKLRVRGDIGMPGVTPGDLSSAVSGFNAVEAHLHVELPLTTLRSFAVVATYRSLKSSGAQALDQPAEDTYSYLLGKILADGYARLEKDQLVADIDIKRGQISINGRVQPYSLIQLLAMLHKQTQAPPQDDHAPPAALLWRDRPLDSVLLFGNNGDKFAAHELCRRYRDANDAEQTRRWCDKADETHGDATPDIKDNTLHDSVEAGHYSLHHFHFDASKTRHMTVKLSNPQAHEKWASSMTVCVTANVPSDRACLVLAKYDGVGRMRASSRLYSADNRTLGEEHVLEQELPLGAAIPLTIYVDDKQAHFLVDGKELAADVMFPASVISLFCSSGDCDFTFD